MPATMEAGTINGYAVGEPWNQQAVFKGIGVPVITDYDMWKTTLKRCSVSPRNSQTKIQTQRWP